MSDGSVFHTAAADGQQGVADSHCTDRQRDGQSHSDCCMGQRWVDRGVGSPGMTAYLVAWVVGRALPRLGSESDPPDVCPSYRRDTTTIVVSRSCYIGDATGSCCCCSESPVDSQIAYCLAYHQAGRGGSFGGIHLLWAAGRNNIGSLGSPS